ASPSCDAAASAGTWRPKPPAAHVAPGGWQRAPHLTLLCQMTSSVHSVWLPSRPGDLPNSPNRRIRTRTYGGVGGEESRDSPLSRSAIPSKRSRTRLTQWPEQRRCARTSRVVSTLAAPRAAIAIDLNAGHADTQWWPTVSNAGSSCPRSSRPMIEAGDLFTGRGHRPRLGLSHAQKPGVHFLGVRVPKRNGSALVFF